MNLIISDQGIVLKKKIIRDNLISLSIFSSSQGKLILSAWGIKKITSRRISHLETGNYIKFNYSVGTQFSSLMETELIYAYSKIRSSLDKTKMMYLALFVLEKILPEDQQESELFDKTLLFLKKINNQKVNTVLIEDFLIDLLITAGFITKQSTKQPLFDIYKTTENIIGAKIKIVF